MQHPSSSQRPALLRRGVSAFLAGLALAAGLAAPPALAQRADAEADEALPTVTRTFAIRNARIVQAPGRVLERGTVLIRNGLIEQVARDVALPFDADVIDGDSLVVYAGFIDGLSHAGIPEPERDRDPERVPEPGNPPRDRAGIQPERAAWQQVDRKAASLAALRRAGFTVAHTVPYGGMLPGAGSLLLLTGEEPRDAVLRAEASLFAQFEPARGVYPATPMAIIATWQQLYREAQRSRAVTTRYAERAEGLERPRYDPVLQAFFPVLAGDTPVFFKTDGPLEVHRALKLHEDLGFPVVLAGIRQGFAVVDALREADVPLFVTLALPEKKTDADSLLRAADSLTVGVDSTKAITPEAPGSFFVRDFRTLSYEDLPAERRSLAVRRREFLQAYERTPALLHDAGLAFGFMAMDAKPEEIRKNLRRMIDAGLPEDVALAALTTTPARLLGLAGSLGTVEPGKMANLVVTTGPYFDEQSHVRYVFVDGQRFAYEPTEKKADSAAVRPAGAWRLVIAGPDGALNTTLTLTGTPGSLQGTVDDPHSPGRALPLQDVALAGDALSFTVASPRYGRIVATATLRGARLEGTMMLTGGETVSFTGTRGPDRRRGS